MGRVRSRRLTVATAVVAASTALAGCTEDPGPSSGGSAAPQSSAASETPPTSTAPTTAPAPRRGPDRPRTARQAARRLAAAEAAILDPSTGSQQLVRAARSQQLVYRELGARPRWDDHVLSRVPRSLRRSVRDNVASRREFRAMHHDLADTLPAWRIVAPAPADELLRYYKRGERTFGVRWEYLAAINLVETAMGRIRGTSVAGAQGPMQFLPSTWARWGGGGDIQDPRDAIQAAARYLAHNGGARPQRLAGALFRYNNSSNYVRGVTHLAKVMERRPRSYYGYYHWDVYYLTARGDIRLPVGYERDRPVPVTTWLAHHAQR